MLNAHYYWKVKADDGTGDVVESPVWDFWTVGCAVGQYRAQYFGGTSLAGSAVASTCESAPLSHDWGSGGPAGLADSYSARWSGLFGFLDGPYTFTATADDGIRLWVDGDLLIDQWRDQAPSTFQATREMTAGRHAVKVEYYEKAGGAVAKVAWQVDNCPTGQFRVQYFGNRALAGTPVASGCDPNPVNHDWGTGSPDAGVGVDSFSARWSGSFDLPAGDYAFLATADDGVRLYVDGELVIDQWKEQAPTTYRAVPDAKRRPTHHPHGLLRGRRGSRREARLAPDRGVRARAVPGAVLRQHYARRVARRLRLRGVDRPRLGHWRPGWRRERFLLGPLDRIVRLRRERPLYVCRDGGRRRQALGRRRAPDRPVEGPGPDDLPGDEGAIRRHARREGRVLREGRRRGSPGKLGQGLSDRAATGAVLQQPDAGRTRRA